MRLKTLYLTSAFTVLVLIGLYLWHKKPHEPRLEVRSFSALPGWEDAKLKTSLLAFQTSCKAFVRQDPEQSVGTTELPLKVKDWQKVCREALTLDPNNEVAIRTFFETQFLPVAFFENKPIKGLFTSYFMPLLKGSKKKTAEYSVPVYEVPSNLVTIDLKLFLPGKHPKKLYGRVSKNRVIPFYTRKEINHGAIKDTAKVLLWLKSPIDRVSLEIEGTGIIELTNGQRILIGYDGENGAPYTSIASVLINQGIMTKNNASMQAIQEYLEARPKEMVEVLNQNKSFVFFRKLSENAALGSQGVALTPGYSLAVDTRFVPIGTPLWLTTTRPNTKELAKQKSLQRLMVAQDTGGAIRGRVRGDVFWGGGDKAALIAGHMKNEGYYWLLLPKQAVSHLPRK